MIKKKKIENVLQNLIGYILEGKKKKKKAIALSHAH